MITFPFLLALTDVLPMIIPTHDVVGHVNRFGLDIFALKNHEGLVMVDMPDVSSNRARRLMVRTRSLRMWRSRSIVSACRSRVSDGPDDDLSRVEGQERYTASRETLSIRESIV